MFSFLSNISITTGLKLLPLLVVSLAIPITLILSSQQQDLRQRAASISSASCPIEDTTGAGEKTYNHCRPASHGCESFEINKDGNGNTNDSCSTFLYPNSPSEKALCCQIVPRENYPTDSQCPTVNSDGTVNFCLPNPCTAPFSTISKSSDDACSNYLYGKPNLGYCCKSTYKAPVASFATPGITPGTTPGITPGVTPGTTPGITPGSTPGVTPGITSGVTPGVTPGATPNPGTSGSIITGRAFLDMNSNSSLDATDAVLSDQEIKLSNGRTTRTDSQGNFSFSNVPAGSYTIALFFDKQGNRAQFNKNISLNADSGIDFPISVSLVISSQ